MSISNPNPAPPDMGYAGIFMDQGEYAMSNSNLYQKPTPNPGTTPNYNVYDNAGNKVISEEYKPAIGISQRGFGPCSVHGIFMDLYNR
jgi:hypothetical protein